MNRAFSCVIRVLFVTGAALLASLLFVSGALAQQIAVSSSAASTAVSSPAIVGSGQAPSEGGGSNEISASGITQFTRPSIGLGYGTVPTQQSSKISFGGSVEYRHWFGNNGIAATYSVVASDASFSVPASIWSPANTWQMSLTRHEGVISYVRRFFPYAKLKPYVEIGAGGFVTHGGLGWRLNGVWQNNSYLGIDGQFEMRAATGFDLWQTRHFGIRTGYVVHWFRAPDTGDPNYRGARTFITEPQIGFLWRF